MTAEVRPTDGQGPYTEAWKTYVPRKVEGSIYELMRETVPFLDAGINRLVSLEGHIKIVGNNEALVEELKEWAYNVRVGDFNKGLQTFHRLFTDEGFEQGFGLGEFVTNRERNDIVALHVADSKTIQFRREKNDRATIHQKIKSDQDPRELKPDNLMYYAPYPEAMNPYGTSIFRSCEFGSKVFTTINNTIMNNFERWGDPSLHAHYKGNAASNPDEAKKIQEMIANDLKAAFRAKKNGNTADFVSTGAIDSELTIEVIGQDGQVLEIEQPVRFVVEQFVAKLALPPWMLGIHWGTTERLSDAEGSVIMADVYNRQAAKGPLFYKLIETLLILRGHTWKPGDWGIEWQQVNLQDIFKQAQANFLNAQASMMRGESAEEQEPKTLKVQHIKSCSCGTCKGVEGNKELQRTEPWPELDVVEFEYETVLSAEWEDLEDRLFTILKLDTTVQPKVAKASPLPDGIPELETFTFSDEQRAAVFEALKDFEGKFSLKNPDSPVRYYYGRAYSAGLIQAALMLGKDRPILDIIQNSQTLEKLYSEGFALVKNNSTKRIREKILPEMDAMVMVGSNPRHVAARLKKRFGQANADWNRLARTEMSIAGETAKVAEWKKQGVETKGAVIAGRDTHPFCRCANTIGIEDGKQVIVFSPAPDACEICMALAG
jgi:hypothetical protein